MDAALECGLRALALDYARFLQPQADVSLVFDALRLGVDCGATPPQQQQQQQQQQQRRHVGAAPPVTRLPAAPGAAAAVYYVDGVNGDRGG